MIPLSAKELKLSYSRLETMDFENVYGKFYGEDLSGGAKGIMRDSFAFIYTRLGGTGTLMSN